MINPPEHQEDTLASATSPDPLRELFLVAAESQTEQVEPTDGGLDVHVSLLKAGVLIECGQTETALAVLLALDTRTIVTTKRLTDDTIHIVLQTMIVQEKHDEVFELADELARKNPAHFGLFIRLYCLYLSRNDQLRASRYYKRIIEEKPDEGTHLQKYQDGGITHVGINKWHRNLVARSVYLRRNGDEARARQCLEFAEQHVPDGVALERSQKGAPTRRRSESARRKDQEVCEKHYREVCLWKEGDDPKILERTRTVLNSILSRDPSNRFALMGTLRCAIGQNNVKGITRCIDGLSKVGTDDPEACLLIASARLLRARTVPKEALAQCAEAEKILSHRAGILRQDEADPEAARLLNEIEQIRQAALREEDEKARKSEKKAGRVVQDAHRLIRAGNLQEAKSLVTAALKEGARSTALRVLGLRLAISLGDSAMAHELFSAVSLQLSPERARKLRDALHRMEERGRTEAFVKIRGPSWPAILASKPNGALAGKGIVSAKEGARRENNPEPDPDPNVTVTFTFAENDNEGEEAF